MDVEIADGKMLPEFAGCEELQTALGGLPVVKWLRVRVFAQLVPGVKLRILLLNPTGIRQQYRAQVTGRRVAVNRTAITQLVQPGNISGVIQVRMGQDDPVQPVDVKSGCLPVALAQPLVALEQAAIHQHTGIVGLDQEFGAGNCFGTTQKNYSHFLCSPRVCTSSRSVAIGSARTPLKSMLP